MANAYTNAIDGASASSTLQYVPDFELDILATLDNTAGTINTICSLGIDFSALGGFDILSTGETAADNLAIALLEEIGQSGLHKISLMTGEALLFSQVSFGRFIGFAAQNGAALAPVPASGLLLIAGLGGLAALRRRKAAAQA